MVTWTGISFCITSGTYALPIDSEKLFLVSYLGGLPLGSILIRYVNVMGLTNDYLIMSSIFAILQMAGVSMLVSDFGCVIENSSLQWELLGKKKYFYSFFKIF